MNYITEQETIGFQKNHVLYKAKRVHGHLQANEKLPILTLFSNSSQSPNKGIISKLEPNCEAKKGSCSKFPQGFCLSIVGKLPDQPFAFSFHQTKLSLK
jgi:hypothetical protein